MSKPKTNLNLKANDRVKTLFLESGLKQKEFAESISCSPQHLNRLLRCKAAVTSDTARVLSEKYHVLPDWVLGSSDCRTREEYLDFELSKAESNERAVRSILSELAGSLHESIKYTKKEQLEKVGIIEFQDCYAFVSDNLVIGLLGVEDYLHLKSEILHYAGYLFNKAHAKAVQGLLRPFPLSEILDDGEHKEN